MLYVIGVTVGGYDDFFNIMSGSISRMTIEETFGALEKWV